MIFRLDRGIGVAKKTYKCNLWYRLLRQSRKEPPNRGRDKTKILINAVNDTGCFVKVEINGLDTGCSVKVGRNRRIEVEAKQKISINAVNDTGCFVKLGINGLVLFDFYGLNQQEWTFERINTGYLWYPAASKKNKNSAVFRTWLNFMVWTNKHGRSKGSIPAIYDTRLFQNKNSSVSRTSYTSQFSTEINYNAVILL